MKTTMKKLPGWKIVNKVLDDLGWSFEKRKNNYFIYQRGREYIVAREVAGTRKWKTELFLGNRLIQSTGFNEEKLARILTMELGMGPRLS